MTAWHIAQPTDLEATIAEFKVKLPGWWYSVCECQVSCDASCAPTNESPDINRITVAGDCWDAGFHADLRQPSSLAEALRVRYGGVYRYLVGDGLDCWPSMPTLRRPSRGPITEDRAK